MIFILSSPSGGGKSSISKKLVQDDPKLALSISVTTRKPRANEVEGVDYFFKTRDEFEEMIKHGEFLEYAEIYSNLYGTTKAYVQNLLEKGFDILFDIDHQGTYQLKKQMPEKCVSIFIMPPSMGILRSRIENRKQDSKKEIDLRMKFAEGEMEHAHNYDYRIVNEDFEKSVKAIQDIMKQERMMRL